MFLLHSPFMPNDHHHLIMFNNVCSLTGRLPVIAPFLTAHHPSLLLMAEVRPQEFPRSTRYYPDRHSFFTVPGYSFHVFDQPSAGIVEGLGGLGMYIKEGIPYELLLTPDVFPPCLDTVSQVAWVKLCLPQPMIVGCGYLHPNASVRDKESLRSACTSMVSKYPFLPILLFGDFNGQHPRWGASSVSGHGSFLHNSLLGSASDWQCLNEVWPGMYGVPTRVMNTVPSSIIDLALCTDVTVIEDARVGGSGDFDFSSDHLPLIVEVNGGHAAPPPAHLIVRNRRWRFPHAQNSKRAERKRVDAIHQKFTTMLDSLLQSTAHLHMNAELDTPDKLEAALSLFREMTFEAASVVYGELAVDAARSSDSWWMNHPDVIQARRTHLQAVAAWRHDSSDVAATLRNETRRLLRAAVRTVKNDAWASLCSRLQDSRGHIRWDVWFRTNHSMQRSALNNVKDVNRRLPSNRTEALNNLARYYASVCDDSLKVGHATTDACIDACLDPSPSNTRHPSLIPHEIGDALWTEEEVLAACKHVPLNVALGPDQFHPLFLRHVGPVAIRVLTHCFNAMHRIGYVIRDWRDADVVSLYKKGARSDPANYRPISLTSIMARMYERMVRHRLVQIIEPRLSRFQFGFRKGRSTYDCLMILQQRIFEAVRRKSLKARRWPAAFLDLYKAFDSVHHRSLLYKLCVHFGITGRLWCFIEAFLTDRRARTVQDELRSEWVHMRSGVPQGSVLGPLLFLCYINDLLLTIERLTDCDPLAFADDLCLAPRIPSASDVSRGRRVNVGRALRRALKIAGRWSIRWRLSFNAGIDKSAVVMFRLAGKNSSSHFEPQRHKKFRVKFGNGRDPLVLPYAQSYKYLGVWFDACGNTTQQFQHVCHKLRRASFFVTRLLRDVHPRIGIQLVNTCIRSILSYGLAFWQPSSAQLYAFDSCMAIPLRRVLGLPNSTHTVGTLAACGIPCSRAMVEHMQMKSAVRASCQLTDDNPAHGMFVKAMSKRYAVPLAKRAPLAPRVKALLASGHWGHSGQGLQQFSAMSPKAVKQQLTSCCLSRGFQLWNGSADEVDRWSERHHHSNAPIKQWYSGNSRKQITCEPSMRVDDSVTARLRARLRHGRAAFAERRHTYHANSRTYAASAACPECGVNVAESASHVLLQCPRLLSSRYKLDGDIQSTCMSRSPPLPFVSICHASVMFLAGAVAGSFRATAALRSRWWSITGSFLRAAHKLVPF